jgi:hypothetical protein
MEFEFDGTAQIILASCYGAALLVSSAAEFVRAWRSSPDEGKKRRSRLPGLPKM